VTSWIKQRTPEIFIDGTRKLVLRWEKMYWTTRRLCQKISICQFVAKILYFASYFHLFKYMFSFSRYFTVCITYQPPLVILKSVIIKLQFWRQYWTHWNCSAFCTYSCSNQSCLVVLLQRAKKMLCPKINQLYSIL
jgi:hypothetical protein